MTTVQLMNLALLKIGVSKGITALSDASRAAWTGEQIFDTTLRATLRRFPWPFATAYFELYLAAGPVGDSDQLVQAWSNTDTYAVGDVVDLSGTNYWCIAGHTGHTPPNTTYWSTTEPEYANRDWLYAYRQPDDCLFVRRVLSSSGLGRDHDPNPPAFRVGRNANGLLVFTSETMAEIEYTTIDCDNLYADDLFINAFTWELGAALAPSMARDPKTAQLAMAMALDVYDVAKAVAAKEQQQPPQGDASWIGGR